MIDGLKEKLGSVGEVFFNVKVVPKSEKTEIVEVMGDGSLKIRLKAVPEKGKANQELIKFLAEVFGVGKNNVRIISGQTSRVKMVKVWR